MCGADGLDDRRQVADVLLEQALAGRALAAAVAAAGIADQPVLAGSIVANAARAAISSPTTALIMCASAVQPR